MTEELKKFVEFLKSKMPVVDEYGEKYFNYLTEMGLEELLTRYLYNKAMDSTNIGDTTIDNYLVINTKLI